MDMVYEMFHTSRVNSLFMIELSHRECYIVDRAHGSG